MAALLDPRPQQPLLSGGGGGGGIRARRIWPRQCSAISVDVPSPLAGGLSGVQWGSSTLQGPRSEMEDDVVLRSKGLDGFAFAAVFDGHAGFSSVEFLRIKFKDDLVTSSPDIYQLDLGSDMEFILLASDGLWDYMKSSDVVTFVRNQLRQHGNVQLACEALAQAALDRKSQDNISIMIADLGRTDWQNLPVQGPNFFSDIRQTFVTVGIMSLGIWISSLLSTQGRSFPAGLSI